MPRRPHFLLLQVRNEDDPMRVQEVECFCKMLPCDAEQIRVHDLLQGEPSPGQWAAAQIVLLGGSGDYSAAGEGAWLERALDVLRQLHDRNKPTFASCWGFQAMARAMGGQVKHDLERAELGTHEAQLTDAGRNDVIFGELPERFLSHMGHEDHVVEFPPDAIHLAFSDRVEQQAFRFADRPIYCTQFHPELHRTAFLERVEAYPRYVAKIAQVSVEEFSRACRETPEANRLLPLFVEHVLRDW